MDSLTLLRKVCDVYDVQGTLRIDGEGTILLYDESEDIIVSISYDDDGRDIVEFPLIADDCYRRWLMERKPTWLVQASTSDYYTLRLVVKED